MSTTIPVLVRHTCDQVHPDEALLAPLREAYPDFDGWFARCQAIRRPCVAVHDKGVTVGLAVVREGAEGVKLCTLVVVDGYRRRGIGGFMLDEVLRIAGPRRVHMTVHPARRDTIRLASRHGFAKAATLPDGDLRLERPAT